MSFNSNQPRDELGRWKDKAELQRMTFNEKALTTGLTLGAIALLPLPSKIKIAWTYGQEMWKDYNLKKGDY